MQRKYQIWINHLLDDSWQEWFDGLSLEPQTNGTTILTGILNDPTALHTILEKINGLNMDLISVSYHEVPDKQPGADANQETNNETI